MKYYENFDKTNQCAIRQSMYFAITQLLYVSALSTFSRNLR